MKKLFLILLCLTAFASHAQKGDPKKKLADIEKVLFTKPDSARVLIRQITDHPGQYHDTIYAMANIYQGYTHLLKTDLDSSIYYYGKALDFAGNSPVHRAKALRFMSAPYRKKGNYEKSLQLLRRAETDFIAIDNTIGLATVYGEMGANYNAMLKPQDAIPYLIKSIDLFKKAKNKKDILPIQQSLANTYRNIGNHEFAIELYEEVLEGFKKAGMLKNYYLTLINYSDSLINLEKMEAAKRSLHEAINGLGQFKDHEMIGSAYAALARIANFERDFNASEIYFEKAFRYVTEENSGRAVSVATGYLAVLILRKKTDKAFEIVSLVDNSTYKAKADLHELALYERAKAVLYKKTEKPDLAIASAKNTIALMDTLNKLQDKKAVIAMQGEIQQDHQTRKGEELTKANTQLTEAVEGTEDKKILWVYLPLLVLAALGSWYFYNSTRHRKKIAATKADAIVLKEEYESKKKENDALKTHFERQQDELASSANTMGNIKDNVDRMVEMFNAHTRTSVPPDIDTVKKGLEELISDEDYWELFRKNYSEANGGVEKKLALLYPDLTKKELFLCSLLKLSLPNKDLAIILQITPDAVKKKKNRMRKKIEINPGDDLDEILGSI